MQVPVNNLDGVRMSTALTYINPNRYRLNLTIKANVMVHLNTVFRLK